MKGNLVAAAKRCREKTSAQQKEKSALDDFEVIPGETLEDSLTRAINYHILGHSFTEIMRAVSVKRLEAMIAHMHLDEEQRAKMWELFGLAKERADGHIPAFYRTMCRMTLLNWLQKSLDRHNMLAVQAYEHHLVTGNVPAQKLSNPTSVF